MRASPWIALAGRFEGAERTAAAQQVLESLEELARDMVHIHIVEDVLRDGGQSSKASSQRARSIWCWRYGREDYIGDALVIRSSDSSAATLSSVPFRLLPPYPDPSAAGARTGGGDSPSFPFDQRAGARSTSSELIVQLEVPRTREV